MKCSSHFRCHHLRRTVEIGLPSNDKGLPFVVEERGGGRGDQRCGSGSDRGAGGLGSAIAPALHTRGARLILTGGREEALNSLASQLNGAEVFVCDLADRGQIAGLIAHLADTDIVVANAALPATGKLDDFTPEQLNRALGVNLRAPMLMTQQLLPGMVRRGRGHFVYISSIAGKFPSPHAARRERRAT